MKKRLLYFLVICIFLFNVTGCSFEKKENQSSDKEISNSSNEDKENNKFDSRDSYKKGYNVECVNDKYQLLFSDWDDGFVHEIDVIKKDKLDFSDGKTYDSYTIFSEIHRDKIIKTSFFMFKNDGTLIWKYSVHDPSDTVIALDRDTKLDLSDMFGIKITDVIDKWKTREINQMPGPINMTCKYTNKTSDVYDDGQMTYNENTFLIQSKEGKYYNDIVEYSKDHKYAETYGE